MLRLIVFVFIGYLVLSTGVLGNLGSARSEVSINGSRVTVTTSRAELNFSAGPVSRLDGRVLDWRRAPRDFGRMGVQAIAAMLDSSDYAEFMSIQNSGRCPAAFLNHHAQSYVFFAENTSVARRISAAQYKQGEQPALRVRPLRYKSGTYKGYELQGFNRGENLFLVME